MFLIGEQIPDVGQIEREAGQRTFTLQPDDVRAFLNLAARPINFNRLVLRIDQPSQLRPLLQVFQHFLPKRFQPVAIGFDFNHKIGAKMPKGFAFFRAEMLKAGVEYPG